MIRLFILYCALCTVLPNESNAQFLESDERRWAKRLNLSEGYVHKIVKAAGYSEDDEARIENLDVHHLRHRRHIFLVMVAGNGHCLTLIVLAKKAGSLEKIWETAEAPSGAGFCHEGTYSGNFTARATEDGAIVVDVPKDEEGSYVLEGIKSLVYRWNGQNYTLVVPPLKQN